MRKKRYAVIDNLCVACGTCLKACPFGAISITDGIKAKVDGSRCVGCGKCAKECPASIIEIKTAEVSNEY